MKRLIWLGNAQQLFAVALALVSIALAQRTEAVSPPPDGGYPNFTTAEGSNALKHLTTGSGNTGIGWVSLFTATSGSNNTAVGAGTLALNTADGNTAVGTAALLLNTTGLANTATGAFALLDNAVGNSNTATGFSALQNNTTGDFNTATGSHALELNISSSNNTAVGAGALESNTGIENTAMGSGALLFNMTGNGSTATGYQALMNNTVANGNTAYGYQALSSNIGSAAAASFNTAIGYRALANQTSGTANIALGPAAGDQITTGDENIDIGNFGEFSDFRTIRIGQDQTATYIAAIAGVNEGGTGILPVYINNLGRLGTQPPASSRRFKKQIKSMDKTSEAILALKPVTFQYKSDQTDVPQFGLIAEEVAAVNPDLIVRDENGEVYSVRYEAVNTMLLNEFLKEHATVQELKKEISALKAGLQSLSAKIDLGAPPLQSVVNND